MKHTRKALTALTALLALAGNAAVAAPTLWIDDADGNLGTVDVGTGAVNFIGNTGQTLTDIAFAPDGTLYGITFSGLYTIDTGTAAATYVGSLGTSLNSLVFAPNGTLYGANNQLYTINTATGAATGLGTNTGDAFNSSGDLAFVGGNLYVSSSGGLRDTLVQVDLASGSGAQVGSIGVTNVYGLATNDHTTLYGAAGTGIYQIDTASGAGTLLHNYGGQGLGLANGTAFVSEATPPIPEPETALLMAVGLGALTIARRRQASRD